MIEIKILAKREKSKKFIKRISNMECGEKKSNK